MAMASLRPRASGRASSRAARSVRARGFLGSPENLAVCTSTAIFLAAGRFGLAPSANKPAGLPGMKLQEVDSGMTSGDPAGFTAVDVLAFGSLGHAFAIGVVLGLKAQGSL